MRKKRLLIAGGGYAEIPLIRAARGLEYHVITSGNRPDQLGHRHGDEHQCADFSDTDAMLRLAKTAGVDFVCASCNDFSAISCSYVAQEMGLPGHDSFETSKILHQKDLYRQFALKHGIRTPRARGFDDIGEALKGVEDFRFPVILKPVDMSGGKGITTIGSAAEAKEALETAFRISKAGRVVVEEFIKGTHHALSAFLRGGRIVFHFSGDEYFYKNPYLVSAASTPISVRDDVVDAVCGESERIADLLSIRTGILHVQYVVGEDGPTILEICRRSPGDLYITLVQHATGVDYPAWIVRAATGADCSQLSQQKPTGFFTRHCVMSSRPGRVRDVTFDDSIRDNVIDKFMWWKQGDEVADVMTSKFGIVFLEFNSMDEMLDKTVRMQDLIRVETC
jgi:biotin carboxylase